MRPPSWSRLPPLVLGLLLASCGVVDDAVDDLARLVGPEGDVPVTEAGQTFVDDFHPPDEAWFLGEEGPMRSRADAGAYVVEGGPAHSWFLTPRAYPSNAAVSVSTTYRVSEQPDDRGGIVAVACHLPEEGHVDHGFGAVVQASEGELYYGLLEWVDGEMEPLVPLDAPAPGFDPDGATALELRCRPSSGSMRVELAINGEVLATADADLAESVPDVVALGLYVDTSPLTDGERLAVRFERFSVDVDDR